MKDEIQSLRSEIKILQDKNLLLERERKVVPQVAMTQILY